MGDLHQLPPIQQKPIFCKFSNDVYNLSHPWHEFKMIALVEIMRQKDDQPFVELLNRLRVAQHTEADIDTIQSRAVDVNDKNNYPLKSVSPKISRIGRQKRKNEFFLIWPKEPIWLPVFGNDIKRFDFLFFSSKFAKLENSTTRPSAAAMRLEI